MSASGVACLCCWVAGGVDWRGVAIVEASASDARDVEMRLLRAVRAVLAERRLGLVGEVASSGTSSSTTGLRRVREAVCGVGGTDLVLRVERAGAGVYSSSSSSLSDLSPCAVSVSFSWAASFMSTSISMSSSESTSLRLEATVRRLCRGDVADMVSWSQCCCRKLTPLALLLLVETNIRPARPLD
jgi:hypothetical protein